MPAGWSIKFFYAFPHKSSCILHTHVHRHTETPPPPFPCPPPPSPPLHPFTPNTHTHHTAGTTHTLVLIWNIVGGAGPVEGSVNSSGATPPFKRPKFPFLRSAAWAGSAVQQTSSRHGRPQRPRWQHFTGTTAWHGWPDGPQYTIACTHRALTHTSCVRTPHAPVHLAMHSCISSHSCTVMSFCAYKEPNAWEHHRLPWTMQL